MKVSNGLAFLVQGSLGRKIFILLSIYIAVNCGTLLYASQRITPVDGVVIYIGSTSGVHSELDARTKEHNLKYEKQILQEHITVTVPNLEKAKYWYSLALPVVEVPRKLRTAVKGAWYKFKDVPALNVHLLEMASQSSAGDMMDGSGSASITGQHVGLDLGIPTGVIRNELYDKGITATLAAVTSTIKNKVNGLQEEQQAIFLSDQGRMTWEFTNLLSPNRDMKLVSSKNTLPASRVGIPLDRFVSSSTATMSTNNTHDTSDGDGKTDKHNFSKESGRNYPFKFSISSGNPLATAAGYICLQAGGSAADATIAAAAVMSIVEPFNGGLGGDFVALIHDPTIQDSYKVLNGSGRAPKNASPLPNDMTIVPKTGVESILSLPGAPSAWCRLHARYGKMPWKLILQPAIIMASEGFLLTERTAQVWEAAAKEVMEYGMSKEAKEEFLRMFAPPSGGNGERMTPRAGERFYNPTLAHTFQNFADGGCKWFYNEAVNDIVEHIEKRGGFLKQNTEDKEQQSLNVLDFASWEKPVYTTFTRNNDTYKVFTAGGNSQGGSALLLLNMLQTEDPTSAFNNSRENLLHRHINAKRIVYRDTFRKTPYSQTFVNNKEYIGRSVKEIQQGFRDSTSVLVKMQEQSDDTEGFVVRDSNGLALSVLQSIAKPFGSGVVVPTLGFPLHGRGYGFDTGSNSEFSYRPGNRPWTTLSPYMVERNGKFWMAASVKGGDRQPYAFTQIFLNIVQLGYSPEDAVSLPRFRDQSHTESKAIVEFDIPPYLPNDISLEEHTDGLCEYLNRNGFESKRFVPNKVEDSGFGVAQILIDETKHSYHDPLGYSKAVQLTAVSDLTRKPGLALTGAQPSLVAENLEFPNAVRKFVDSRDLELIAAPFRKFSKFHLQPLSESELSRLAKEGLSHLQEPKKLRREQDIKLNPLAIARTARFGEDPEKHIRHIRRRDVREKLKALEPLTRLDVCDINSRLTGEFDAFIFQPGDYPTVAMKDFIFPVGPLPLIGVDPHLDGLREHNSELFRLLRPLVSDNIPALYDSRDPSIMTSNNFATLPLPLVVKEGQSSGRGISIVLDLTELEQNVQTRYEHGKDFIIQEALKGKDEFTIHFIAHYGRLLSVECFKSKFEKKNLYSIKGLVEPINKGRGFIGCAGQTDAIKILDKIARGTLYNGFGCLQYKRDPYSAKVGIIEINPRTCGGLFSPMRLEGYLLKVTRMIRNWVEANSHDSFLA